MTIREHWEQIEFDILRPEASKSATSRGRRRPEEPCAIRTAYQRDRDRIVHAKSFRRLKHKTQVFISPNGDHYRTRLTHTLEVSQISRTIARGLRLNEDLTEAIALGHDLGHTPFGHSGEAVLNRMLPEGFRHNEQSLRIVDRLEKSRQGLNLTEEVRDGILNHTGEGIPFTLEGQIVRTADRIAYINHDIDDALRAGVIRIEQLPKECVQKLGDSHSQRIDTMVKDMIFSSRDENAIKMSQKISHAMDRLRMFLFEQVYVGSVAKKEEKKVVRLLEELFSYYQKNPQALPEEYQKGDDRLDRRIADYISGMTDSYAVKTCMELLIPLGYGR